MTTNLLAQSVTENRNGVEKGSSKNIIAYMLALTIIFLCIYPAIAGKEYQLELIGMLMGNLLLLLGISAYHASVNPPKLITDPTVDKKEDPA
jgi:hypothetical protein